MTVAVIITVFLLLSFFGWQYVFSIYEVKVAVVPEKVSVGDRVSVRLIPLNSFGKKAPFRKVVEEVKVVEKGEGKIAQTTYFLERSFSEYSLITLLLSTGS